MGLGVVPHFGVYLPQVSDRYDDIPVVARRAEELGFHSVWLSDHMMPLMEQRPFLECWTALSAVAAETRSVRLGTIVMCNSFRHPSLLAKMSATLDVISNGRLILGLGAGYVQKEYDAYGFRFPAARERVEQLAESLKIIKLIWKEERASFEGKHYVIRDAFCEPKPVQKPHPPILIGGTGKRISRVIAEQGDYCNLDRLTVKEAEGFLRRLRTLCDEVGRPPQDVRASLCDDIFLGSSDDEVEEKVDRAYARFMTMADHAKEDNIGLYADRFRPCSRDEYLARRIHGTTSQCIDQMEEYLRLGVDLFILVFPDILDPGALRMFQEKVLGYFAEGRAR